MTKPFSQVWSDNKFLRQTPRPIWIALVVAVIFIGIWWFQQFNVNALGRKINILEQKIARMTAVDERLKLEKDILVIEKDKTTIQNGVYTTLVQAAGGLILSITAYVGYCNLKVAEDKQVTERFSKAIEHLGSDKIDIRLGGIYSLEQIAIDSPKYHWTVVEILSAFVREKCLIKEVERNQLAANLEDGEPIPEAGIEQTKKVSVDIQATLTVLGRRQVEQDPSGKRIDLRKVDIALVELQEAKLSNVNLRGAILNGAYLMNTDFTGAKLENTNFENADLSEAILKKANLMNADLSEAILENANLLRADLSYAHLVDANLRGANLRGAKLLSTNLSNAILCRADLTGVSLVSCKNLTREQINLAIINEFTK